METSYARPGKPHARVLAAVMAIVMMIAVLIVGSGATPAYAATFTESLNGATAVTTSEDMGPGEGKLTLSSINAGYGVDLRITGGTLAASSVIIPVDATVDVAYACETNQAAVVTIILPGKSGPSITITAPCGEAAPEPPAPVGNQAATIGEPRFEDNGLATVDVTLNNNGYSQEGTYSIFVNQALWSTITVPAHDSLPDVVSDIPPGSVVQIYGDALPDVLAELTVGTPLPGPSYDGMTLDDNMFSTLIPTGPFNQIDFVYLSVTQGERVVESQPSKEADGTAPITSVLPINPPPCGDYQVAWLRVGSNEQVASLVVQQASCTPEEPPAEEEPPVEEEPKPTPIEYAMTLDGSKSTLTASGPLKQPERLGLAVFVNEKLFGDAPEYVLFDGTVPISASVELPKCNSYVVAWVRETGSWVRAVPVTQDICPEKPAPVPNPEPEKEPGKDPKPVDETDSDKDPAEKPVDTKKDPVKSETPSKVDVNTSVKANVNVSVKSETTVIKKNAAPHKAKHDSAVKEKQSSNDKRPRYTFDTAASSEPQQATHHVFIIGFCVLMILCFTVLLWRNRKV